MNSINPGVVETEGSRSAGIFGSDIANHAIAETPLGRSGQPEDIAPIAVFLASDDSRWLTGETLLASGGMRWGRAASLAPLSPASPRRTR